MLQHGAHVLHNEGHYDHRILVYIIQGSSFHLAVTTALILCMIWSVRIPDDGSKCRSTIQQRGYAAVTESADLECCAHHFEPDPANFSSLRPMSLLPSCHVLSWLTHDLPIVSTLFQKKR